MWKSGLVLLSLVGCSSASSSPAPDAGIAPTAVDVTIQGTRYHAAQAISSPIPTIPSGKIETGMVILSSATDACAPPDARVQHPGEMTIVILLKDGDGLPTGPAAFPIFALDAPTPSPPPPRAAVMYATVLNASCANDGATGGSALQGTVTLTAVRNGAYAGTFDAALDTGDRITGTFDADLCTQLPGELASTTPPTCAP